MKLRRGKGGGGVHKGMRKREGGGGSDRQTERKREREIDR